MTPTQPNVITVDEPETDFSVRAALGSPRRLRTEVLAGLVVALALIPEAISFSILAGVDPRVGLFASFTMAVTIAFVGGRRAMISAATGAIALVIAPLVASHGLDYFIAAVILAGILQIVLSLVGVAKLMRFLPRSVMVGFVNALAILIFTAQIPYLIGVPWLVYPMVAIGLVIMVGLPRMTTAVPAPLVAIVALTTAAILLAIKVPTVGDQGDLPESLPSLFIPDVPFTLETLQIIAPYAFAMALVGLLESLMTAKLVDDVTDSHSDKTREAWGQGTANIVTGFFGGMGGCAMIGQTMINVKVSGARTRISTFLAGVFLLALVVGLGDLVATIPMAALVAVMIMVSVSTMDWHSIHPATLRRMPFSATAIMATTVAVTVYTHNLAYGVIARGDRRDDLLRPPGGPLHRGRRHRPPGRGHPGVCRAGCAVLRLQQRPRLPVRLRRRPAQRRHRPQRGTDLRLLHRRRARRDRAEVPPEGQERADRRAQRSQPGLARQAHRTARRRPLRSGVTPAPT